jgi:large subunit ribosomal protein L32
VFSALVPLTPALSQREREEFEATFYIRPWRCGDTMAVPKRRQSNQKTGSRRAHDAKRPRQIVYCEHCSTAVPSHAVCPKCGHYMGREVMKIES